MTSLNYTDWRVKQKLPTLTWVAQFSCGHTAIYSEPRPAIGDEILCVKGNHVARVKTLQREFFMLCTSCRTPARRCGLDYDGARKYAERHAMDFPHHHVYVMRGGAVLLALKPARANGSMLVDLFSAEKILAEPLPERDQRERI